ncbi:MAG: hypothetical protein HKP61_06760 [Dactylosporangium sp.]|nr:hypothetical protein [Dactylosporangium sp.]NNJ60645.1 hypothetical protein [Dactylosporangium sp.]
MTIALTTPGEHPVHADPRILADLRKRADILDTSALTVHVRALGIPPPTVAQIGWSEPRDQDS